MRKFDKKYYLRLLRLADYVERHNAKKRRKLYKENRDYILGRRVKRKTIVPPNVIIFHGKTEYRKEFRKFVNSIDHYLRNGYFVKIDFRKVERLHPCGVLLLLSWVRLWVLKYSKNISANYPNDEVVEQMLQSVGILQALGLVPRAVVNREEVTRWFYFQGESVDTSSTIPFMEAAKERLGEASQAALYDSVAEAITNVTHHAYDEHEKKNWWIFANITDSHVTLSILDTGKSIPGTLLEKPGVWDVVKKWRWGNKSTDKRILEAAMGGKSRTKLPYRGKGLPEMLESTKNTLGSALSVYSRSGLFVCQPETSIERSAQMLEPIDGTLILWSLKV